MPTSPSQRPNLCSLRERQMNPFIPYGVGLLTGFFFGVVAVIKRPRWFKKF